MTDKRVYYNDEEVKYVEVRFRGTEYGKGKSGLENYFMEFPEIIEKEGMEETTGITQVKIYETNHFFEVKFLNEEDEMLTIHKIPYELITEINIESKKCKDLKIPMTELSKKVNEIIEMTNKRYRTRKEEDEDRLKALDRMKSLGQLDQEYPNEKAALEEYRNRIHEIMGDESIDIIINELKKEGAISQSFKPDYEKIRRLVESKILEGYHSTVVPSRPFIKAYVSNHIIQYADEISEKT